MTLQQIADYAMEYLDCKGVAADYGLCDNLAVRVYTDENEIYILNNDSRVDMEFIRNSIDSRLI